MLKKMIVFSLVFSASLASQATVTGAKNLRGNDTLVVSDIDDTIKLSHVLSKSSAAVRAMDSNSWFLGINSLYQLIQNDNPGAHFVYVSAAPEFLLEGTHKKLLANGQFPRGQYIARNRLVSSFTHKVTAIRKVLHERKPKKVIFIGDNGEKDALVYRQLSQEFKNSGIEFHTFIRMVYSPIDPELAGKLQPLFAGQFSFVTPVEMGLELRRLALIGEPSIQWIVDKMVDFIMPETMDSHFGVLAFPTFLDCRGFRWPYATLTPIDLHPVMQFKLKQLFNKVSYRCSKNFHDRDDD